MEQKENETEKFGGATMPRVLSGVMLLIAGTLLLAYKMGAPLPPWIFTWPVILITIGLLVGIKSKFHNPGAFIMILVGIVFLIDQSNPQLNFKNYIFPLILIGLGIIYIFRPKNNRFYNNRSHWVEGGHEKGPNGQDGFVRNVGDSEYVKINAIFGGVKKNILSKSFKGGEVNSFMGGTELNLLQADLQYPAILEINNVFGGTKIVVPANWDIKNEVTAIFGGIEDKRNFTSGVHDPNKVVIIKGACIFGGIEIANF